MPGQVVKEIEARFRANTTSYRQEIADAGKLTTRLREQIRQTSAELSRAGGAAGKQGAAISRSLNVAQRAAERISKTAQTLVGRERELSRAVDEQTRKLADQRSEYQRLSADVARLSGVYDTIREATKGLDLSTPLTRQREQASAELDRLEQEIRTLQAGIAGAGQGQLVSVGDSFIGMEEARSRLQALIAASDQAAERFWRLDEAIRAIGEENLGYASGSGLRQLQSDIAASQRRMAQLEQQAGQTESRLATYTERLEDVRRSEEQLGESTQRLTEQVTELGSTAAGMAAAQSAVSQQSEQSAGSAEAYAEELEKARQEQESLAESAKKAVSPLSRIGATFSQAGETISAGITAKLKEGAQGFFHLGSAARIGGSGVLSSALTFAKAMVGVRSVYMLIRRFRSAMVEGYKELSNYSKEVKTSLGTMSAASTQWKNSIAAAFAPLVNVAAPYITTFISHIADAFNAVGAFFAALTGQSSYTRAVYNYKGISDAAGDAASATHDAAEAQKELNRQLMGFDEINKLNDNSSGSGGSNGGGGNSSGESTGNPLSFVTESIPGGLSDTAQKIRDFFSSLDFGPLETAWGRLTEAGGRLADIIKGGLAWGLEHVLKPLAQWSIEEAAPRLVELLANAFEILADVCTIMKPVWGWVWENLFAPLSKLTGNILTQGLDNLNDVLEDIHGGLQDIIGVMEGKETLGSMLKRWFSVDNLESFQETIKKIFPVGMPNPLDAIIGGWDFAVSVATLLNNIKENLTKDTFVSAIKQAFLHPIDTAVTAMEAAILGWCDWVGKIKINFNPLDGPIGIQLPKDSLEVYVAARAKSLVLDDNKVQTNALAQSLNWAPSAQRDLNVNGNVTKAIDKTNGGGVIGDMTGNITKPKDGTNGKGVLNGLTGNVSKWKDKISTKKNPKVISGMTGNVKTFADNIAKKTKNLGGFNATVVSIGLKDSAKNALKTAISKAAGSVSVTVKAATRAKGGVYQSGRWSDIPQYAGGTLNGGSMFIAGEAGPEIVGHIGGRTEVLNQSQIASAIYSAMVAAMSNTNRQPTTVQVVLDGRVVAESTLNQFRGMVREGRDPLAGVV